MTIVYSVQHGSGTLEVIGSMNDPAVIPEKGEHIRLMVSKNPHDIDPDLNQYVFEVIAVIYDFFAKDIGPGATIKAGRDIHVHLKELFK